MVYSKFDYDTLLEAINLSKKSPLSQGSFSVGAIIVNSSNKVISTGFTREIGEKMHAEEVAIKKAQDARINLKGAIIYSSLEPCGERLSGKECCALKIIKSGIKKVVFALKEPPLFVKPKGTELLIKNNIEVEIIDALSSLVKEINNHLIK